jgi:Flp pilus assembly protein TadG
MKTIRRRIHNQDSGQVLVLFALLTMVIIGLMGLASDIGRIYVARSELGRSVDAAALAGAKQLPDTTAADTKARQFIAENEPSAIVSVEVFPNAPAQQVEVRATKTVSTIFMRALGIGTVNVRNSATAGFGVVPVDAVLAIDATSSMAASCNSAQNNSGCEIWEAKNASKAFTNTLLPGANTVVGVLSYRGCFRPSGTNANCVATSTIGDLNGTASNVITKIDAMSAIGGTGTNVCGGLSRAYSVLTGVNSHAASNTQRIIVILTDGDNNYNSVSYVAGSPGSPVAACRPSTTGCPVSPTSNCNPANSDPNNGCSIAAQPRERQLDTLTKTLSDTIKTAGAEIFVVGFGVCGSEDGITPKAANGTDTPSYCSSIGGTASDNTADQRLLKCMASSTQGTNDHYFRATTASQLPTIFQQIAQQIAFRLIK